jgi:uncharacterized membrane protein
MLKGQFRDPVLGRDVLIGALIGLSIVVFGYLRPFVEAAIGQAPSPPEGFTPYTLEGLRGSLATIVYLSTQSLTGALSIFFVFFLVRRILRRSWLAAIIVAILFSLRSLGAQHILTDGLFSVPVNLIILLILLRFGLVALASFFFVSQLATNMPITTPIGAWYAEGGILAAVTILLVAFYGFQVARAGKPLFAASMLDS